MKKEDACPYSNMTGTIMNQYTGEVPDFISKQRNKRVQCPTCKRKMWAARRTCPDGCCVLYCVPPHKKKGWWKKKKAKKKEKKGRKV